MFISAFCKICELNTEREIKAVTKMQSWAKLGKVDMFSKEVIKKQSWQSWYICLFIIKHHMQSKVGKVQI